MSRAPALPAGPLDEAAVRDLFEQAGALRHGHFALSSGRHSDSYVQCAVVLQWPELAAALARELAAPWQGQADVVVGPALGGVVIGHELARALGLRMVFTERAGGVMALRRSFEVAAGERALLAENVVTTGGSVLEVAGLLGGAGAAVVGLATLVDRLAPGRELGVPRRSLLAVSAADWAPADCPACAAGEPLESPGSRRLDASEGSVRR